MGKRDGHGRVAVSHQDAGPIRVMIVDDHPGFARGLKELLDDELTISVVRAVPTATAALDLVARDAPDVALLDVRMPETSGVELASKIRGVAPSTRVLMLTVSEDRQDIGDALRAGAAGYLSKRLEAEEIAAAIRLCLADVVVLSSTAFRFVTGRLIDTAPLSPQDRRVLELAAKGAPVAAIADELAVSRATATRLISRLQRRLGVANRDQMVAFAARRGWV